jgi:hypothetical protein
MTAVRRPLEETGIPIFEGFDADSLGFERGNGEAHNTRRQRRRIGPGL